MPDVQTLYVATKNTGKLHEFRALFAGSGFQVQTYPGYADVPEGETSYAENAGLKAIALAQQLTSIGRSEHVLGDDSGIEVAALGGRPGVLSARYGGPHATWAERRALIRHELAASGSTDRSARFLCALHFISSFGRPVSVEGFADGEISARDSGESGFSYDAAFWYPPAGMTFGDLDDAGKNLVSARAHAVTALLHELASIGLVPHGNRDTGREDELPPGM